MSVAYKRVARLMRLAGARRVHRRRWRRFQPAQAIWEDRGGGRGHPDGCSCDAWRRQMGIYGRSDFSPGRFCIAGRWFGLRLRRFGGDLVSRFGGDLVAFLPWGGIRVGRLGLGAG
jgi:hypothetical protein